MPPQMPIDELHVECQVLDPCLGEGDVAVPDAVGYLAGGCSSESEHVVVDVHTEDLTVATDDLGGDEAHLTGAAAEVEHTLALPYVPHRVAAAVVPLEH